MAFKAFFLNRIWYFYPKENMALSPILYVTFDGHVW